MQGAGAYGGPWCRTRAFARQRGWGNGNRRAPAEAVALLRLLLAKVEDALKQRTEDTEPAASPSSAD